MTYPALSEVLALYSLQKAMMFTPLDPNAGPTGGAGVALPASSANFTTPITVYNQCTNLLLKHSNYNSKPKNIVINKLGEK